MIDLATLLGQLQIPPEQLARIAEQAKSNPLAAMGLLNEYVTPEQLQQLVAIFMQDPGAVARLAEQAGVSPEQLTAMKEQLGAPDEA